MSENKFTVPAKTTEEERRKKKAAETARDEKKPAGAVASRSKATTAGKTASKPKTSTATKPRSSNTRKPDTKSASAKAAEYEQPELFDVVPVSGERPRKSRTASTRESSQNKTAVSKSASKPKASQTEAKPKKEKTATEEKPKTRFRVETEKPSLEANLIPDMSLLSASERHRIVMGQEGDKKAKSESRPAPGPVKNDEYEHSLMLETIRSSQKAKRENVKIPELGHRTAKKKNNYYFLWALLAILVVLTLTLALFAVKNSRTVPSAVPAAKESMPASVHPAEDDSVVIRIEAGMSAGQVASLLSGYVDEKALLDAITSNGLAGSLRVGTYRIGRGADPLKVARVLAGQVSTLTIPDGMTVRDIDTLLMNRDLAEGGEFLEAVAQIAESEQLPFAEGWFLTGSYQIQKTDTAFNLASDMHQALLSYIRENAAAFNESEYSLSSILIIASMLNRETQDETQMRAIASVIYNRLEQNIALGIDATTRYEIDDWVNPLSREVLDAETPYNTRRKKGLPPSGIGCVSVKSLSAALHPDQSDYLYYFHAEDGSIHLTHTYDEHLAERSVVK